MFRYRDTVFSLQLCLKCEAFVTHLNKVIIIQRFERGLEIILAGSLSMSERSKAQCGQTNCGCGADSTTMFPWFTAAPLFCLTRILLCTAGGGGAGGETGASNTCSMLSSRLGCVQSYYITTYTILCCADLAPKLYRYQLDWALEQIPIHAGPPSHHRTPPETLCPCRDGTETHTTLGSRLSRLCTVSSSTTLVWGTVWVQLLPVMSVWVLLYCFYFIYFIFF